MREINGFGPQVTEVLLFCSFFAHPKNEPKNGAAKDNFALFWQNACGVTRPKKSEVRAFFGQPSRR
jgi:hypothetical protein